MTLKLRPGRPDDAEPCGRICYEAFAAIARAHNFPPDFPAPEFAVGVVASQLGNPRVYSVVAELDGEIVGSNFLDERCAIVGVGPVSVAPGVQDRSVGRALMADVMRRAEEQDAPGIRLVQSAYHNRSFSLYAKLGFEPREQLACLQGGPIGVALDGYSVRPAGAGDVDACNALCRTVHGVDRGGELLDAVAHGTAVVVEHDGRVTGYATGFGMIYHAVGETNEDVKALVGSASGFLGPGVLVPTTNAALLRWCLEHGLRVVQLMTLMTIGLYNQPAGAWLPSVLY